MKNSARKILMSTILFGFSFLTIACSKEMSNSNNAKNINPHTNDAKEISSNVKPNGYGPFGLNLGKSTKQQTLALIKEKGGKVVSDGYKIVEGDVSNHEVEGIEVHDLPVKNINKAIFWFYKGTLYEIDYIFPISMNKEEFYVLYKELVNKYGPSIRYVKPYLADGLAVWKYRGMDIKLSTPWASPNMYLTYFDPVLLEKVKESDKRALQKYTSKPQEGL